MVMPERLPTPLPAAPEGPASTASAARVVAAAKVASAEFTARPKRRSFSAKYKLPILAETDGAGETGGISAILRREGLYSSALSDLAGSARGRHSGRCSPARAGRKSLRRTLCRPNSPRPTRRMPLCAAPEPWRLDQAEAIIAIPKKWQPCWTRWIWRPAAAASHDGRRRGIDPGRRPDDGGLRRLGGVAGLCASASHGADYPATRGETSATCRAFLAGN